ncbi:thiamine pyrophosphate-binding protein [Heliorestis convoluta]|uniref:Thiamine pyrophosphate TPP-binding domain-containing protein n=1 Tax=Heliorestis convoluta TaxID=356322 RepID=A0A5Q2MZ92_9FIRM|nr:thiamine pyrophosphate-binding protein [Heliorestis convoluta]QGG47997.1 thiamine pyrophosphate TPP-binding domain-containing protein [Heliorestis convoluta]
MVKEEKTVARWLLEQLHAYGVRTIYGVPGDGIIYLLDELARFDGIRFFPTRHEEAAAFMAVAHAKLTGQIGVCTATAGPGAGHLINGLADGAADNVPVLAITGQVESFYVGTWHKQYIDLVGMMNPVAEYSAQLTAPDAILPMTVYSVRTALARQGVSHLSIPKNLFPAPCKGKVRSSEPYLLTPSRSEEEVIDGLLPLLQQAEKPVILAGQGTLAYGDLLRRFAEHYEAAVIHTLPATGVISHHHPLVVGALGKAGRESSAEILYQADLCLKIGATWWPSGSVPSKLPVVQIDCRADNLGGATDLLYAVAGDGEAILSKLLSRLPKKDRQSWRNSIEAAKSAWLSRYTSYANPATKEHQNLDQVTPSPLLPQRIMEILSEKIDPQALVAVDVGDHTLWFARNFLAREQRILVSGKWRSMGSALPYAITAKSLMPHKQVVALIGDGGFLMSCGEMVTARQENLPVKVVLFRNKTLATEENRMRVGSLIPLGNAFEPPDFAAMARSCRWQAYRVDNEEALQQALHEALHSPEPTLIDVDTANPIPPGTKV